MENKRFSVYQRSWPMICLLLFCAWLLSACTANEPMRFYMLSAEVDHGEKETIQAFDKHKVLGLGPIHLPDYLDRPQMVVELTQNQYRLEEHHRWAERLDANIGRVLAQLLGERLAIEQVVRHPWPQKQTIDFQVSIDILEFHRAADGISRLKAQWQIKNQSQTAFGKVFDCGIPTRDEPDAIVKAQSQCLGRLGMDIVEELVRQAKD